MELKPIADNRQRQLLTVALKNICRDYPAGGGVLRELLQNADDAGATVVRFMLDERTHKTDQLISPMLQKYQGPALLSYNNAVFTDRDFLNLSRLGDSLKVQDGLMTGKFGRGFNSVYNWTDSPSIVSRERLLILDPHQEWSTGGPVYDFVENFANVAIQNHMEAFQSVMESPEQPLDGTIIRIPLRTEVQAKESEISNRETSVLEVRDVLQKFAIEFGDSGLLFMRNVEKLGIESSAGISIEIEIVDRDKIRSHKSKVKKALKCALENLDYEFDHSVEVQIEHRSDQESRRTCFVAHHSLKGGSMDNSLRDWAKDQKLVPWVAVAAQLQCLETMHGSLFTVLPLPILINQPVHIHGLFSISPDRARLYQFSDSSSQDQAPARWNSWLFQSSVPMAWTKLLSCLADLYPDPDTSPFEWWPRSLDDPRDLLADAIKHIVGIIDTDSLPLFPTAVGYVTANAGLLNTGNESTALIDALLEAQVPIVYVPQRLRDKVKHLFNGRLLSPRNLCVFLNNDSNRIERWTVVTKQVILEYLMSEPGFTEYGTLELFPFEDGKYRSIAGHTAFVHRDEFERNLFALEQSRNIDLDKVSAPTKRALVKGCGSSNLHPSIQYRSVSDFKCYCLCTVFNKIQAEQDSVVLDIVAVEFVCKAWIWIIKRGIGSFDLISDLWLIPLTNGRNRKIIPLNPSSEAIFAPVGEKGDLLRKFDARCSSETRSLLDTGPRGLSPDSLQLLIKVSRRNSNMLIKDGGNMVHLASWLSQIGAVVESASDEEKDLVVKLIASNLPSVLPSLEREAIGNSLSSLVIFKRVYWKVEGGKMVPRLEWTRLNASRLSVGLLDGIIPVPGIDDVQFLDARWPGFSQKLLVDLQLANCLETVDIIQIYIIPAWKCGKASGWAYSCKEHVATLLLRQYFYLSLKSQEALRTLPMVPVVRIDGEPTSKFAIAAELIDPSVPDLKDLFFDDEETLPTKDFFDRFGIVLKDCGLKTAVDEVLVNRRIHCYASSNRELSEVQKCAHRLLESACHWTSPIKSSELRQLEWLPIFDLEGNLGLKAPKQCRGSRDRLLVSFQLPVFELPISVEWETRLGWRDRLPNYILLAQLFQGLRRKDRAVVDAVLTYIDCQGQTEQLADDLLKLPCILTSTDIFVTPSKAFRPTTTPTSGCENLHPYLGSVDNKFWHDHEKLLTKLKIGEGPSLKDLLSVQKILESKEGLAEADVAVAIEILRLASHFPRASLADLRVLSEAGNFCPIQDINFHDLGFLTPMEKFNLTHPDIPLRTIKKLGIEVLSERLLKGLLEIADIDDEDEFDQREQVTTRIVDTLDRYPVNTTFREYLANADDTNSASKISWLLDERYHPCKSLLTPELKNCQGPALLVHNNGVFSDDDFKGFKNVGEGSKRGDQGTIGEFGRGSQTMYHWTDVPMILSGRFLLILDPQQEVLPKNKIKGKRKPGVKLELSKLRNVCPDQLAPFEGLWDYQLDLDYFPGTIFRFPLRARRSQSKLRVNEKDLDIDRVRSLMGHYFEEARISLLFLRRINSIDFKIYGKSNPGWSVSREESVDEDFISFSDWKVCSFTNDMNSDIPITGTDKWWVAIEDLRPETDHLPFSPRRVMKNVESGIAALVSSKSHNSNPPPKVFQPRMFNVLPLPISSDLPIYIHATFSLSGDRQSLIVDEHGQESHGSKWNRYLLETALPKLYLSFLEDLGGRIRQDAFRFWPQEDPPKRSCSEILCSAFWKKLPETSRRLFPKAQLGLDLRQRRAPELFDINQAIFDFLPNCQSDVLAPLLLSFEVKLVWHIPIEISKHLRQLPEVNYVTGSMLRKLFKSESAKLRLQKEMSKNPRILKTLLDLVIPAGDDLGELDGCCFLPLADGTLGTLRLCCSSTTAITYYKASAKEMKLFEFSSGLLLSPEAHKPFAKVLKSENFNLEKLHLRHVRKLLEKRCVPTAANPQENKWLAEFWDFWNKSPESSVSSLESDINDCVLFQATFHGTKMYLKPSQFQELPAVVEPSMEEHKLLAGKIPGLYRLNQTFMPVTLEEKEGSFYRSNSFYRFIKAVQALAVTNKVGIGAFLKTHLNLVDLTVLRNIVITHGSWKVSSKKSEMQEFLHLKADLRSIPLWPSCDAASSELISANDVLRAESYPFLVPWMKNYPRFIDSQFASDMHNQNCLRNLGIEKLPVGSLLVRYILPLPAMLLDLNWRYYQPLIAAISQIHSSAEDWRTVEVNLTKSKIASDRNRTLHKASKLFDQEDPVFVSAFRDQDAGKFLHNDVKGFRQFWLKVGLRHRKDGNFDPADYLQCIQAISRRLATGDTTLLGGNLWMDTRVVLSPLTTPDSSIRTFGASDWLAISKERVFHSRALLDSEPVYRKDSMAEVAIRRPFLALSEIVSYNHVAVCWSQTPFALYPPTNEVFGKMRGKGKPPLGIVWRHLDHLREMAQNLQSQHVQNFLSDLHSTYAYLQDHLEESRACFSLSTSAIWLNINSSEGEYASLDSVQSLWHEVKDLVLSSSCDAGRVKAVRPSLMRYEKLLRALGCNSIIYPTVTRPIIHRGHSVSASLRKLRDEGKLLDVTYSTEGRLIKAHRVVLAAVSEKCARQFSGRWAVEDPIKYDEQDDPEDHLSYHTLSAMINYAYDDGVDWSEMEVSEADDAETREAKLHMLLDLHKGADSWLISALASQVEDKILVAGKKFINIENVEEIRQRAEEVRAKEVEKMCNEFIEKNRATVERANSVISP